MSMGYTYHLVYGIKFDKKYIDYELAEPYLEGQPGLKYGLFVGENEGAYFGKKLATIDRYSDNDEKNYIGVPIEVPQDVNKDDLLMNVNNMFNLCARKEDIKLYLAAIFG